MPAPPKPDTEAERLEVLEAYGIAPGVVDEALDSVARCASRTLGTPLGLVTLIGEETQLFPGAHGWSGPRGTSREVAFCGYTILSDELLEVRDALQDPRFADNRLVTERPYLRFYAGAPLITPEGQRLGSVCALDTDPRVLEPWQGDALADLAKTVIGILEGYRRQNQIAAQKQQSDRLIALGELSAGIAHEINNALQPLVGMSGTLKDMAEPESRMARLLGTMETNAIYARKVVAEVLVFARRDSGEVTAQDALEAIDQAIVFVQRVLPGELSLKTEGFDAIRADGRPRTVNISHQGAIQVVHNLIRNAGDAIEERGDIVIRVERGTLDSAPALILSVVDEGPGMEPSIQERIFDPFFTTKPVDKGSGLGLSTVHGLVESWGGRVSVDTAPGAGTAIRIALPIVATD